MLHAVRGLDHDGLRALIDSLHRSDDGSRYLFRGQMLYKQQALTPKRWNLANELKGIAYLKRDTKKDLKPSHVEILRNDDGTATIVYLFPRSVEITKKNGRLEFVAQIGRVSSPSSSTPGRCNSRANWAPADGPHPHAILLHPARHIRGLVWSAR
jgi:hypothetical protein